MGVMGEIFRAHGKEYRARFGARMSLDQLRAMRDIEACHTSAAGEALWRCPGCGKRHFTFVGCGNRHCPACGSTRAEQWLRKHCALLLPGVVYHLITFTVPEGLRRAIRSHPRELLELLMRLSAGTLLDVCANDKWLGATPGLTAVLHTWTREYWYHPHVHFIGTGGGLNERGQWINTHPKFLVPERALSSVFRARFRDALREQYPDIFARIKPSVWKEHDWVVKSVPVGAGKTTLAYLARYVYRVALSERSILGRDPDGRYAIRYRKSGTNVPRTMRLEPMEFIRRFLQHVLPSGFRKIRYFGLHHSSKRQTLRLLQAAMAMSTGSPLPMPPPEAETFRPACSACNTLMDFERRFSANQRATLFPAAIQTRGPP
jgi:hypothetical protein